jgi:hypothetical protein
MNEYFYIIMNIVGVETPNVDEKDHFYGQGKHKRVLIGHCINPSTEKNVYIREDVIINKEVIFFYDDIARNLK